MVWFFIVSSVKSSVAVNVMTAQIIGPSTKLQQEEYGHDVMEMSGNVVAVKITVLETAQSNSGEDSGWKRRKRMWKVMKSTSRKSMRIWQEDIGIR